MLKIGHCNEWMQYEIEEIQEEAKYFDELFGNPPSLTNANPNPCTSG